MTTTTATAAQAVDPEAHIGLAVSMAKPVYARALSLYYGITGHATGDDDEHTFTVDARYPALQDFITHAKIGLWRAAEFYDRSKGVAFSTFAYGHIKTQLNRAWRDFKKLMKQPAVSLDAEVEHDKGGRPKEMHEVIDIEEEAAYGCLTLPRNLRPDQLLELKLETDSFYKEIRRLPRKMRNVIVLRYGLNGSKNGSMTQEQVAANLNISRATVIRLETRGMIRLEKRLGTGLLEAFHPDGRRPAKPKGKIGSNS